MENFLSKKNLSVLWPLILVMALDLIFTLAGQPEIYWRNHRLYNESNPLAAFLLGKHPALFVLAYIFYFFFILFLSANLKRPFNLILSISVFLIHVWATTAWAPTLVYRLLYPEIEINWFYSSMAYLIFIGLATGIGVNKFLRQ